MVFAHGFSSLILVSTIYGAIRLEDVDVGDNVAVAVVDVDDVVVVDVVEDYDVSVVVVVAVAVADDNAGCI